MKSGRGGSEDKAAIQGSFDDLGTPLIDTTFVVVDLETTGGSPEDCHITEIGAVKIRGGEVVGEFQTLINPGTGIPPFIAVLTGITDAMVAEAPRIESVLPSFFEFCGSHESTYLVAHNAPFDILSPCCHIEEQTPLAEIPDLGYCKDRATCTHS